MIGKDGNEKLRNMLEVEDYELITATTEQINNCYTFIEGVTGWLTPEGVFYPCSFGGHSTFPSQYMEERDRQVSYSDERKIKMELMSNGFIAMSGYDMQNGNYLKIFEPITIEQKKFLLEIFEKLNYTQREELIESLKKQNQEDYINDFVKIGACKGLYIETKEIKGEEYYTAIRHYKDGLLKLEYFFKKISGKYLIAGIGEHSSFGMFSQIENFYKVEELIAEYPHLKDEISVMFKDFNSEIEKHIEFGLV